jgi:hypothetical protein
MLSFHLSLFFLSVGAATGSSLAGWLALAVGRVII